MKISKIKYYIWIIPIIIVVILFALGIRDSRGAKTVDINKVLKTDAYSYLSEPAKEYIKDIYEKTGNVLLTEKNKEVNKPYLNPMYVKYLSYSEEEKKEEGVVPFSLRVDYQGTEDVQEETIPTSYDLRSVNGKNFITPVRDQGDLGICWTFASAGAVESHLLKESNTSYSTSAKLVAERQMDYSSAINGLKDYDSEYVAFIQRSLGSGGNVYISSVSMASGISVFDYNNFKEFDDTDYSKMEIQDVLSHGKSTYELNGATYMPTMTYRESTDNLTNDEKAERLNYLNTVKSLIMENGAAYVATMMSNSCRYNDSNLNNVVIDVYNCDQAGGHAMEIIGWNDNYQWSYCADTKWHNANLSGCNNVVSGKGVWILKNSWGSQLQYPYLTYDSLESDIASITDIAPKSSKNWDNNYVLSDVDNNMYTSKTYNLSSTNIRGDEKIKKIKFLTLINGNFKITITKKDNSTVSYTKTLDLPGLATVDVSEDVVVDSNSTIKISSTDGYFIDKVLVFTSNVDTNPFIDVSDYNNGAYNVGSRRFYSQTKNIPSLSAINYKLYDANNVDLSSKLTVENNLVAENNVNPLLTFSDDLVSGSYRIDVLYNSNVIATFPIALESMNGLGTASNPYIITSPAQLDQVRNNLSAYYELGNDIDLTNATREGGDFYNKSDICSDGYGWSSINGFTGSFDGKGHTIKGLYQNNSYRCTVGSEEYYSWNKLNGLFGYTEGNVTIKNLVLDDFDINCYGDYCGALMTKYLASMDDSWNTDFSDQTVYTANIQNVVIKNSHIRSTDGSVNNSGGGLIGYMESLYGNVNIENIYIDIDRDLKNISSSGLLLTSIMAKNSNIKNIRVLGNVNGKYNDGSGDSVLIHNVHASNPISIKNVLSTVKATKTFGSLFYMVNGSNLNLSGVNGLKTEDKPLCNNNCSVISSNVSFYNRSTELSELTKRSNYNAWEDFDTNWKLETVDGIARIPVLKMMNFEYTSIPNISISQVLNTKYNIYDYVSPKIEAARDISFSSNNSNIVQIEDDGTIVPKRTGSTTIHVESYYDGYIKNVPITINYVPHYTIEFNANEGTGSMDQVEVPAGQNYTLPANVFEREFYEFKEWNTKADGTGTSYNDLAQITGLSDKTTLTLYAIWIGEERVVTFNPNGGTVTPSSKVVRYKEKYGELPIPVRSGYAFNGWSCGNVSITSIDTVSCTELKAGWTSNAFTVVYDANGGVVDENYSGFQHFASDSKFTGMYRTTSTYNSTSENPFVRTGYKFKEWNTKADGTGEGYKASSNYTINQTVETMFYLYAIWEETSYTIHFNANGGTGTMNDYIYSVNSSGVLPANTFTRTNYIFKKWCTNADGTGTCLNDQATITNLFSDNEVEKTLYAIWENNTVVVTFYSNYGSNSTTTQTITKNQSTALKANTFSRQGYKFVKWNTKANGTGTSYNDKQSVTLSTNISLYAIWQEDIPYVINTYTVDETNGYVDKIPINTDINAFKTNVILGTGYSVVVDTKTVNNKQVLYTGGKTKIMKGSTVYREFTNIVRGDINGDGKMSSLDYVRVKNHIMGTGILTDDIYKKAADANADNKISALDYVTIKNYIMNGGL